MSGVFDHNEATYICSGCLAAQAYMIIIFLPIWVYLGLWRRVFEGYINLHVSSVKSDHSDHTDHSLTRKGKLLNSRQVPHGAEELCKPGGRLATRMSGLELGAQ